MEALQVLVDRVRESGVFKRNRTPLEVKVLAAMLCFAGLSYRRAAGSSDAYRIWPFRGPS